MTEQASEDTYAFPCSSAQERLWFLQQVDAAAAYNMPVAVRLTGPLDLDALADSVADLVRRHESLRTSFDSDAGQPVQVVHPSAEVRPAFHDLRAIPEGSREQELSRLLRAEIARRFDLRRCPLMRLVVLRRADHDHIILFVIHHILCDAWSVAVLLDQVGLAYARLTDGLPAGLPEQAIQYADYSLWQRDWLAGEAAARQLSQWRERLAGAPLSLDLPTDMPRPPRQSYRGARHRVHIAGDTLERLRAAGDSVSATLFMTLLAGFGVLLYRYTGQADIVIGTPVANRRRAELEHLIGFLANTLAIRLDMSGEPTFRELLARVRDVAVQAYDNQDLPFDVLVEKLRVHRDPSRHPLFQVMFALQNVPVAWPEIAGLRVEPFELPGDTAKFDLLLEVSADDTGLSAEFEYSRDLFTAPAVQRMAEHLRSLLEMAVDNPDLPVGRLPLTASAGARHSDAAGPGDAAGTGPLSWPRSVSQAVDEQARRAPGAIAVRWPGGELSYRELAARGAALAARLGACRDEAVAVQLPSGADRVVAVLAVLRAGGSVLMLDPELPERYRQRMLTASTARVIVTADGPRPVVPGRAGAGAAEAGAGTLASCPVGRAEELAALAARLQERFGLATGEGVLSVLPAGHPDAVWVLCWPLAYGGCVILPAPGTGPPETLATQPVAVLHCSPDELRRLIETEQREKREQRAQPPEAGPRLVLCGAGQVPARLADAFAQAYECPLYGVHQIPGSAGDLLVERCVPGWPSSYLPLGTAVGATRLALLDRYGQPVPEGAFGGLHLLDTAADGPPVPLGMTARQRADLRFELADRTRSRVAWVDGVLVDVTEAETALLTDRVVADVLMEIDLDEAGQPIPVAWIVPGGSTLPLPAALSALVRAELPEAFVPQRIFLVEELPVGPDGRLDPARARALSERPRPVLDVAVASWLRPAELREPLRHCLTEFGLPPRLRLAAAGQVIRALRDPDGIFVPGGAGANLVAIRAEDLAACATQSDLAFAAALDAGLAEFCAAARAAIDRTATPWVVLACPPSASVQSSPARSLAAEVTERRLVAELSGWRRVRVLPSSGDSGAGLAVRAARAVLDLSDHRLLALIVDAGDVLRHTAGERPELQQYLLAQHRLGTRLCLAGVGTDQNLLSFFRAHRNMPLALRHLTSWRLDWDCAGAVSALLAELGLQPDRVAYLTTSAVRSALVAAALPEILALRLPGDAALAVAFLRLLPSLAECAVAGPAVIR